MSGGEGGIRTHVPFRTRRFRGAPVTTTSVPLRDKQFIKNGLASRLTAYRLRLTAYGLRASFAAQDLLDPLDAPDPLDLLDLLDLLDPLL